MKILITGLSSAIMQTFAEKITTHEIWGVSRKPQDGPYQWLQRSFDSLTATDLNGFDMVIHAAAVTHCKTEKEYMQVNLEGTQKLIEASKAAGVKRFVYVSSRTASLVAGGYAKSKFLAEQYIIQNFDNWLIFRPSEVFGGQKNEGIEKMISDGFGKGRVVFPAGGPPMKPISVSDTAAIMFQKTFDLDARNQILTLCGQESFGISEMLDHIEKISHKKITKLALPEFVMKFAAIILTIVPIKVGMVPDQVARFYAPKEDLNLCFGNDLFSDYLASFKA